MKHIITYTNQLDALTARAREVNDKHAAIQMLTAEIDGELVETDAVRLTLPMIGAFYNTIEEVVDGKVVSSVTHSIALIVLPNPYDEDGNLIGLLKDFEGILEILAVGRTDNVNDCPFAKVFADPEKCVKYDLANPLSKEIDEEGNETDKLMPRTKFGVHDLTSTV